MFNKVKTPLKLERVHLKVRTKLKSKGCKKSLLDILQRLSLNSLSLSLLTLRCMELQTLPVLAVSTKKAHSGSILLRVIIAS